MIDLKKTKNRDDLLPITLLTVLLILLLNACSNTAKQQTLDQSTNKANPIPIKAASDAEKAEYQNALNALRNKNLKKAEQLLLNLSKKRPDLAGPWANLGLVNLQQNKLDKAEEYLNTALQLNPKMPQALNTIGLIATQKNQIKKAEKYYTSAIEHKSDYAKAHYNLALLYDIYLQNIKQAIPYYRRYLQLIDNEDKDTLNWLEQLENSIKN